MSKHMTIINLACTITKLRKWGQAWKHSAESAQNAASRLTAEHERKLAEHRAAFGARTEADRRIIEGLRAIMAERGLEAFEAGSVLGCVGDESPMQAARRVVKERDGLLTQVKDQRAEIERLQWENQTMHKDAEDGYAEAIKVLGDPIALSKERDALRAEVEFLKTLRPKYKVGDKLESYSSAVTIVGVRTVYDCQTDGAEYPVGHSEDELKRRYEQTPKQHPVKVGEWVRRISLPGRQSPVGVVKQVTSIRGDGDSYGFADEDYWAFRYCEPCDQPATHDTSAGKASAESAAQHLTPITIKGLWLGEEHGAELTVSYKHDDERPAIVLNESDSGGTSFIYLTREGARETAAALLKLAGGAK